ncbi:threonine aldolase family protein [Mesorhizobium captivum]|uniref:threonine aldolase family protein n=1 Tax=Mesorhizobium captivum TaxID=3072319 RepID=UPI003D31ABB0
MDATELAATIHGANVVHYAQPAAVSITQACENRTLYALGEFSAISETARAHGLNVHMDGARFANALVALGASPAEMTWRSGVEVLSFGGTKNGCLAAEAVIFFKPEMAPTFPYLQKRSGQLLPNKGPCGFPGHNFCVGRCTNSVAASGARLVADPGRGYAQFGTGGKNAQRR